MANGKGIALKEWITIASFMVLLFGLIITWANGRTQRALIDDQVKRNTQAIDKAELKVLVYKIGEIEKKVDLIYDLVK